MTDGVRRADRLTIAVCVLYAALGMAVLWVVGWNVAVNGFTWSGASGWVLDSMQYLAWVREIADHGLSADLFSLEPPVRDYFNPALGLSALLVLAGLPVPVAYALWTPVGILVFSIVVVRYSVRMLGRGMPAVCAVAIALLYKIPSAEVLQDLLPRKALNIVRASEAWPVFWAWGFGLTLVSVALLCWSLMLYEDLRGAGQGSRAKTAGLVAAVLACTWLQPWQGVTLVATLVAAEYLTRRFAGEEKTRGGPWLLAWVTAAVAAPLAYYAALGHFDPLWAQNSRQANDYFDAVSWWMPLAMFAPLLAGAAFALVKRPVNFRDWGVRLWAGVAIAQMLFIDATGVGNTATHALKGVTVPLAILAVSGLAPFARRLGGLKASVLAVVLVVLVTAPGGLVELNTQLTEMDGPGGNLYFLNRGEKEVLGDLQRQSGQGSVMSTALFGSMVPWRTGRQVWVGHETWTPNYPQRAYFAEVFAYGGLPEAGIPVDPVGFVRSLGVRFALIDCAHNNGRLASQLRPVAKSVTAHGCAALIELKSAARAAPPKNLTRYRLG